MLCAMGFGENGALHWAISQGFSYCSFDEEQTRHKAKNKVDNTPVQPKENRGPVNLRMYRQLSNVVNVKHCVRAATDSSVLGGLMNHK